VDVVEIGNHDPSTGAVYAVKPIAALAMIDEGELDWKVIAVSAGDPGVPWYLMWGIWRLTFRGAEWHSGSGSGRTRRTRASP